jgi:3-phenylpropionate/trans-cinnamate dioxygenase ferredoxin component
MSIEPHRQAPSEARFVVVAELAELPNGCLRRELLDGHGLVLARTGDTVFACQGMCPHEKADLSQGRVENGRLICPRHLASFDLQDGQCSAGWKLERLRLYPVRVEDGRIAVDLAAVLRDPPSGPRKVWDLSGDGKRG